MKSCGEIPFYGDPPAYRPGNGRPLRVVPTHITYCTISFRRGYPSGETVARSPRGLFPQGSPKENPLLLPRGQKNRPAVKGIAGLLFTIGRNHCSFDLVRKLFTYERVARLSLPSPLELICQCSSLYTAISFINGTRVQNTGNKNFTNHLPLQKSRTALNGNADTIHNGHIVFFAAGNQCTFLPCNILPSNNQRENLIDYTLDLCRDGVPIYRHGEYNSISIQN